MQRDKIRRGNEFIKRQILIRHIRVFADDIIISDIHAQRRAFLRQKPRGAAKTNQAQLTGAELLARVSFFVPLALAHFHIGRANIAGNGK